MSFKLRSFRQDILFNAQTINATVYSKTISLDEVEGPASVQLVWINGATVDMDVSLQFSNNGSDWTTVATTTTNITTNADSIFWDFSTGAEFVRIEVAVTTGSADFSAFFNGKSR